MPRIINALRDRHTHMHTYSTDESNVKKTDMPAWAKIFSAFSYVISTMEYV